MNKTLLFSLALFQSFLLFSQKSKIEKINLPNLTENNIYFNFADFLIDDSCYFFTINIKKKYISSDLSLLNTGEEITNNDNGYQLFKISNSNAKKYLDIENLNNIKLYKEDGSLISVVSAYEVQLLIEKNGSKRYIAVFKSKENTPSHSGSYFVSANISETLPTTNTKHNSKNNKLIKNETFNQLFNEKIIDEAYKQKYMLWWNLNVSNNETFVLASALSIDKKSEKSILYNYSTKTIVIESDINNEGKINYITPLPCAYKNKQLFIASFTPSNSKKSINFVLYFDGTKYVFSKNGNWVNA